MLPLVRVVLVFLTLSFTVVVAQDRSNRELLKPFADTERKSQLSARHEFDIRALEFFAKPETLSIYEFNLDALEKQGETITITLESGEQYEMLSHGIERNPEWRGALMQWSGEVPLPGSKQTIPVELFVTVRSRDPEGKIHYPDPNREMTLEQLRMETGTYLAESYERLDEELIYALHNNSIQIPRANTRLGFAHMNDDFDFVVVYEIDSSKTLLLGDDVIREDAGARQKSAEEVEIDSERDRRQQAYDTHIENLKRELKMDKTMVLSQCKNQGNLNWLDNFCKAFTLTPLIWAAYSWQTTSMLCPSGPKTKAA